MLDIYPRNDCYFAATCWYGSQPAYLPNASCVSKALVLWVQDSDNNEMGNNVEAVGRILVVV